MEDKIYHELKEECRRKDRIIVKLEKENASLKGSIKNIIEEIFVIRRIIHNSHFYFSHLTSKDIFDIEDAISRIDNSLRHY